MFEGWVADLLATYLGKFIDVQKDQLGISLWSGGRPPGIAAPLRVAGPAARQRRRAARGTLPGPRRSR
jgi:hypothetical protein